MVEKGEQRKRKRSVPRSLDLPSNSPVYYAIRECDDTLSQYQQEIEAYPKLHACVERLRIEIRQSWSKAFHKWGDVRADAIGKYYARRKRLRILKGGRGTPPRPPGQSKP